MSIIWRMEKQIVTHSHPGPLPGDTKGRTPEARRRGCVSAARGRCTREVRPQHTAAAPRTQKTGSEAARGGGLTGGGRRQFWGGGKEPQLPRVGRDLATDLCQNSSYCDLVGMGFIVYTSYLSPYDLTNSPGQPHGEGAGERLGGPRGRREAVELLPG